MTTKATFTDYSAAMVYAATNGLDINAQDDYCDICDAYHVGIDHNEACPPSQQCAQVTLQGFSTVLECRRTAGHDGWHSNGISSWGWAEQ